MRITPVQIGRLLGEGGFGAVLEAIVALRASDKGPMIADGTRHEL